MPNTEAEQQKIPFATLMASSVHDVKNILATVLESVDWLLQRLQNLQPDEQEEFKKINHLLAGVNSELMQLLCFFKFENDQYSISTKEQLVDEFLDLQLAFLSPLLKGKDCCSLELDCADDLYWGYDEPLLATAIRNAAINSMKFAKSKIIISARKTDNYLQFSVEDDGPGFATEMLGKVNNRVSSVDFTTGSTGLGLFFAETVAKMHSANSKTGYLVLANDSRLGGAAFRLYIP